jgi:hypothetical protein
MSEPLTPEEVWILWADALETTDKKQGKGRLAPSEGERCCLGVLCDLAVEHGVIKDYGPFLWLLPSEVATWADLAGNPQIEIRGHYATASIWNDAEGATFADIAAAIRAGGLE